MNLWELMFLLLLVLLNPSKAQGPANDSWKKSKMETLVPHWKGKPRSEK